ncbi:hypothetical protein [Gordonibacter sp.]|uniref:hypothetical protein n=2 Tax=Gordonibacter sp. TaxID=1968902 RepID=UPI002FCBB8D5
MADQRRYKMISFDLSTEKLRAEFGYDQYRKAYSLIGAFFAKNSFDHHQYSGYLSRSAMSYAEIYDLVLNAMVVYLPWLAECTQKFDATNVASQSNMLRAIQAAASSTSSFSLLDSDEEILL